MTEAQELADLRSRVDYVTDRAGIQLDLIPLTLEMGQERLEAAEARVDQLEAALGDVNERLTTALMGFSDDVDENAIHAAVVVIRDALKGEGLD